MGADREQVAAWIAAALAVVLFGARAGTRFDRKLMDLWFDVRGARDPDPRIERAPLPIAEAESIARGIAAGLSAAHAQGFVHRDLKPANVMLTTSGLVKILDFGLAKRVSEAAETATRLTRTGLMVGTLAYMSPEQAQAAPVDHRADLWALGVVLYEMLGGVSPFEADSPSATLARILGAEPRPVAEIRPDVPPRLVSLIGRLLRKVPEERMRSAAQVLAALT